MDKDLQDFLKSRNVSEEIQSRLVHEKMGPEEISNADVTLLTTYFTTLGDSIAIKQFCKKKVEGKKRKEGVIDLIRKKLSKKRNAKRKKVSSSNSSSDEELKNVASTSSTSQTASNVKKSQKQIFVGWLCSTEGDKHKQVRLKQGGGTRKLCIDKSAKKLDILDASKYIFFKNGKSSKGNAEKFNFDVWDFQQNPLENNLTVEEMFKISGLTRLRFYLVTTEKNQENNVISDDSSREESFTLNNSRNWQSSVFLNNGLDEENVQRQPNIDPQPSVELHQDFELHPSVELHPDFEPQLIGAVPHQNLEPLIINANELTQLVNSILDDPDRTSNIHGNHQYLTVYPVEDNSTSEPPSLKTVLWELQKQIIADKINKFNVYRGDIFNCCLRALHRSSFNPFYKISAKFSDLEGSSEGAVDDGGPTREMFRMLMAFLKSSNLFTGIYKKCISLNNKSLNEKLYYEAGRIIALSLIHGGPGPHFLADSLYSIITVGADNTSFSLNDVEDDIKNRLEIFINETDLFVLQDIVTSDLVFSTAGCNYIYKLEEKAKILEDVLKFYAHHRVKEPISQFIEGLKTCGIHEVMLKYPSIFKDLMCESKLPLTAEVIEELFEKTIDFSEIGSNKRNIENRTITYFRDYLLDLEENSNNGGVTLADLLIFATGADSIPPLGFPHNASLCFLHNENKYPTASTCSLELRLPTIHMQYEDFKENIDFAIGNCNSFGFA